MAEAMAASSAPEAPALAETPAGVRVSFAEGADREAALATATEALRRDGAVVLDDLIDPALLAACKTHIETHHPDYGIPDEAEKTGPYVGRHTAPVVVDGPLADPAVLLPEAVEHIAKALLGDLFMIDTHGVLVSMPGAPDQDAHPDAKLFPEAALDHMLPAFAYAVSVPLVRMDEVSGRTAFWLGSHRQPNGVEGAADFAPVLDPGSVALWDFRVWHQGQGNRGEHLRPMIFSILSRPWWTEVSPPKATKFERFSMTRTAREALKPRLQYRTRRARLVNTNQEQSC